MSDMCHHCANANAENVAASLKKGKSFPESGQSRGFQSKLKALCSNLAPNR